MNIKDTVLHRCEENPVIKPSDITKGYSVGACGQTMHEGKYTLLIPVQLSNKKSPAIFVAKSAGGENFEIENEPFIIPGGKYAEVDKYVSRPCISYIPEDETYYITRPLGGSAWGKPIHLSKTKDFKTVEEMGLIALPHATSGCIFQGKVNGRYAKIDRRDSQPLKPALWISFSDDLRYWGEYQPLLQPYTNWNDGQLIPTPPIKTKAGWLVIYCGEKEGRLSIGAILLDLNDPTKVKAKANSPILTPNEEFEYMGITNKPSVDTCGAIVNEETDEIRIYYCGAGMSIGMAKGSLSELLELIEYEDANFEEWIWS